VPEQLKVGRLAVALVGIGGAVPISVGPAVGSLLAGKPADGISDDFRGPKRSSVASTGEQRTDSQHQHSDPESIGVFFHGISRDPPRGSYRRRHGHRLRFPIRSICQRIDRFEPHEPIGRCQYQRTLELHSVGSLDRFALVGYPAREERGRPDSGVIETALVRRRHLLVAFIVEHEPAAWTFRAVQESRSAASGTLIDRRQGGELRGNRGIVGPRVLVGKLAGAFQIPRLALRARPQRKRDQLTRKPAGASAHTPLDFECAS
jgi:hypothetical protein